MNVANRTNPSRLDAARDDVGIGETEGPASMSSPATGLTRAGQSSGLSQQRAAAAENDDAVPNQGPRSADRDAEVRDRAYFLWEEAGRPCGREHEFWARASDEIEGDQSAQRAADRGRGMAR